MGLAQKQLDRDITLHDEGIVSDRRLDQAQHAVHELELRTKTIEQSLKLAGMTNSEIKKLNDAQELRLEMIIRSPVDGIVLEQYGVAGQRLDGSDPVYRIADLSKLWLEIDVPVSRSSDIFPETIVLINPQRDSTRAHILHVGRNVNKENQTVVVRAVIDDGSSLSPGQFVSAVVTKGGDRGYYELPANSIVQHEGGSYIFIRSADGIVVREVSILRHSRGRVVIAEGISGDESVVIEGAVALKAQWLGMGGGE
jgi:cobalt-zinc-cadmium efflux system membrane fusion protein